MLTTLAAALILATEEAGEESGGIDLLIPEPSELIAGILAFLIVFAVVRRFALPAINKTLEARQRAIKAQFEAAEAAKQKAESLRSDYQQQLDGAKEEANRIVEDARQAGEAVRADIVVRAEGEAEAIRQRAQEEIGAERDRLAGQLRREVADLSLNVAEKVVGESLDDESQRALVDRFIDELGSVKG